MSDEKDHAFLSLPLKANGTALAAFFAIVGGLMKEVDVTFSLVFPGWCFLLGVILGYTILSVTATVDGHYRNLDTILKNDETIRLIEERPNQPIASNKIRLEILEANASLRGSLLKPDFLKIHHIAVNYLANGSYACLLTGCVVALIGLSSR